MAKYIFVTGGVISGLGKGITTATIGRLLKMRGYKVSLQKFDAYINVNAGNINPYQHGEVFVTDDGAETDLDIGHYERFTDENSLSYSSVTAGKVYSNVINKERNGEYLGTTVQVIPHITNEIKEKVYILGKIRESDVVITEIGGTVGDIELQPFLEAARQVQIEVGRENCMFVHLTLIPYVGELKSKPTQHSVKELLSVGIHPDVLVCRTEMELPNDIKQKISLFCNVAPDCVIQNLTTQSIYEVPLLLEEEGLGTAICHRLGLGNTPPDKAEWEEIVNKIKNPERELKIALIGNYIELHDAYLSASEALYHAGIQNKAKINIKWLQCDDIDDGNVKKLLDGTDGVLIPGGFGETGIDGKAAAIKYAREKNIPYLGICAGMQAAVVEFAHNTLNITNIKTVGENMKLGLYPCGLSEGSRLRKIYGEAIVHERCRHNHAVSIEYKEVFEANGMKICGTSPNGNLCEAVELDGHPFFIGVNFHPEYKSRPNKPHPLFCEFIKSALK